jgi:glycosyltransferase involved in cell wall biosynthesis
MSASVAVCLCTYNGADHLADQLASLDSQVRLPDQIVVGDDCSEDGTVDLLERWAASTPLPVSFERRRHTMGHVANLESTLRRATSDLILICDQDDIWSRWKVQRLASVLEADLAAAGAFSDSGLLDETGARLAGSLWRTLRFNAAEQASVASGHGMGVLLRRNVVAGHALAFRRDRLDALLPFPDIYHADWWLALGLLADGGLLPLAERLVDYRLHQRNAVGLRSRTSMARRLSTTSLRTRSQADAALLEELVRRLDTTRSGLLRSEDRVLLQSKIAHSSARGSLPTHRFARLGPVSRSLTRGDYRRFSNGWRSALIDLVAPPR